MARPKNFPNQIDATKAARISTAGLIKIGWKAPSKAGGMARIPGFVIAHDTLGPDGLPVVDEAAMLALGMTEPELAALLNVTRGADEKNMKAADVTSAWAALNLPQSIYFVIDRTPMKTPDGYDFNDSCSMDYQRFMEPVCGADGKQIIDPPEYQNGKPKPRERKHFRPWCIGDGETAKRIQDDGTVKSVPCQLVGNGDPATVCPWAKDGSCKAHTTLAVTLAVRRDDRLEPLTRIHGVRHRIETKSPHNGASFFKVLDTAAAVLDGNIGGIDGTLRFVKKKTVYSAGGRPNETTVGRVVMELNPFTIEARLMAMRNARGYHIAAPEPTALLSAPEDAGDAPEDTDAPNPGEDMAPPLQPGEPSRGEAINAGLEDGHDPLARFPEGATEDEKLDLCFGPIKAAPAKMTMKEIGALLRDKFLASCTSQADAVALIKRLDYDPARIEAALDADIKARKDAMADEAAAKPAEGAGQ